MYQLGRMRVMKIVLTVLVALTFVGCSGDGADSLRTAPSPLVGTGSLSPTGGSLAMLFGMVVDERGGCIVGATVEVVRGQGLGQSITQTTPCDAWGYSGGFVFNNGRGPLGCERVRDRDRGDT
jgi:hypothetical protein